MEIGLESGLPTYSGGLGVLAGDTIRAAADLKVPLVAVTLLHRRGHFLSADRQSRLAKRRAGSVGWLEDFLTALPQRVAVSIAGRPVQIRCWKYNVTGVSGFHVPAYLLDTDLPENTEWDRTHTHVLYGGDHRYRLCQEVVLGIGGVRILRALG